MSLGAPCGLLGAPNGNGQTDGAAAAAATAAAAAAAALHQSTKEYKCTVNQWYD